jgi:hypothetical protein
MRHLHLKRASHEPHQDRHLHQMTIIELAIAEAKASAVPDWFIIGGILAVLGTGLAMLWVQTKVVIRAFRRWRRFS